MMKVYYENDASLKNIQDKKIAIIGYGIQGRAQALNLRDSGCDIIIGNRQDSYNEQAIKDGFDVSPIKDVIPHSDIILLLIPDQAQKEIYNSFIKDNLQNQMLVFAHGYSIHFNEIVPPKGIDVALLAPRMPGEPIRDYYLDGGGVPAFVDIFQNASGRAWDYLLALAKGIGATKAGAMHVTFQEETEIDLYIEQFLLPLIIRGIRMSFDELNNKGFTAEALLMELYASGEIGELILKAANQGIYKVWQENASPTCQFGIFNNSERVLETHSTKKIIHETIENIRNKNFVRELTKEAENDYKSLNEYNKQNQDSLITKTQNQLYKIIKYRNK